MALDEVLYPRHLFSRTDRPMFSAPSYNSWSQVNLESQQSFEYHYHYSEIDPVRTSENSDVNLDIKIIPNPSSNHLLLITENETNKIKFSAFSSNGSRVLYGTYDSGESLDITNLTPGVYIYNANIDGELNTGSFIKI